MADRERRTRRRRGGDHRASLQTIRMSCLKYEQSIGRPIDCLNDIQRALDALYEQEWERRKRQG